MNKLLAEPLFYIYFIYGASFLAMSLLIVNGIIKGSSITLVSSFYMLVFFGVAHGTAELIDWVRFISGQMGYGNNVLLQYTSQILMIISFVFLMQFAINLLTYKSEDKGFILVRTIPLILLIAYLAVVFLLGISDINQVGLLARYSFGFTGALLTAVMLFREGNAMKLLGNKKLIQGFWGSSAGFGVYAVCGGLIINPLMGLPIQLFRASCAVVIAIASASIIEVFKVE